MIFQPQADGQDHTRGGQIETQGYSLNGQRQRKRRETDTNRRKEEIGEARVYVWSSCWGMILNRWAGYRGYVAAEMVEKTRQSRGSWMWRHAGVD